MRLLGVGLVIASVGSSVLPAGARADPTTPQISPIHLQREDAQRVHEQQRDLDRHPPSLGVPIKPDQALPAPDANRQSRRAAGIVLLVAGGVAALSSIPFLTDGAPDNEAVGGALLATAAIAGVAGFVVLELGRSNTAVVLAPRATPSSLGLTLVGRL